MVVSNARGVPQQIVDRHRPDQRHELELAVVLNADFLVPKLRYVFRHRIVQQEMTFLKQHHDPERYDQFCHREDAEDAVERHRRGRHRALPAKRLEPADLAAARDHHGDARDGSLVDVALERVRHPLQSGWRKPERFRLCLGKRRCLRNAGPLGGGLRGHDLSRFLFGLAQFWPGTPELNKHIAVNRFALALGPSYMLETARIGGDAGSLQECSSIGRAPVSKTGVCSFEPCHSCQPARSSQPARYSTELPVPPAQLIVAPPSITMVCPVVKVPAAEPRNTAAPAISSGSPMRASGERTVDAFSVSGFSHNALAKSVLIRPGAMQFTRMLCLPYSQARLRASCMSAAFEIA